jgi:hypothetical protein
MQELIGALISQVGVNKEQAQGGAGAIFKAAQDRLGGGEFDKLLGGIPGVKDLITKAPATGGGLGGMLGGLASKMGGSDIAQAAQLLSAFSSLGLSKDTAMKFFPVMMQFLQSQGGPELVTKVRAALKL